MSNKTILVFFLVLLLLISLFALTVYVIARDDWSYSEVAVFSDITPLYDVGNIRDNKVEQKLVFPMDNVVSVTVYPRKEGEAAGVVYASIMQGDSVYTSQQIDLSTVNDFVPITFCFSDAYVTENTEVKLCIETIRTDENSYFSVFYGPYGGRDLSLLFDDADIDGMVSYSAVGTTETNTVKYYWISIAILDVMVIIGGAVTAFRIKKGKAGFLCKILGELKQYSFLLQQLISRDFNTKYRQSVLGVIWSFLNPLLTAAVLYFVFSTLFKSDMEYYAAYLICGIVFWNFFTESANLGLESITSYAGMINKVYVPKYIYPVSRVISSLINLGFSLIPLLVVCMISGVRIGKSFLLLPFPIFCLFLFACGMSLQLSTANVFWRDTKFLWGIVVMMWTYLTPIFYSEAIIPVRFIKIYRANPMYQVLFFVRSIVIEGKSPMPANYLFVLLSGVIPLAIGTAVFKKNQRKFILYL